MPTAADADVATSTSDKVSNIGAQYP